MLLQLQSQVAINLSTFLWAIGILITIIIALIAFIGRFVIKFNDAMNNKFEIAISEIKIDLKEENKETLIAHKEIEADMKEIKENYLTRFDKIYKLIGEGNASLLELINKLRLEVALLTK